MEAQDFDGLTRIDAPPGQPPMISVVICTRNRAVKLDRCLRHIRDNFRDPDLAWQLIVVDKGSSDGTRDVIGQFAGCLPLKYASEARPGLSSARNRGIVEAEHPIIAFTDDDCLVNDDWVRAISNHFAQHSWLSILGGRVDLADAGDYPVSIRTHAAAERVTTVQQVLSLMSGCNMSFRREVFDHVGLFDPAFGKGQPIGSGEDIDLLYRALKRGSTIAYSPHVVVRHGHGRDTPEALQSVAGEYLRGRGAFYCKFIRDRQIAKMAYWEVSGLLAQWLRVPRRSASPRLLRSLAAGAFHQSVHGLRNGAARAVNRLSH